MRKKFFISIVALTSFLILILAASASAGELQRKLVGESAIEQIAKRDTIRFLFLVVEEVDGNRFVLLFGVRLAGL